MLVPGVNPKIISMGSVQWPIGSNLIYLVARTDTANSYSCFRQPGASSAYQVTAGKTFRCVAAVVKACMSAGTTGLIGIGYADTAATWGGGAAPTNPVFSVGGTSTFQPNDVSSGGVSSYPLIMGFSIPAQKYPMMSDNSASYDGECILIGYEE